MLYEASIYQMEVEGHSFWVAESKVLKGCVGQGETSEEAIHELELNESEWICTAKEFGISIPPKTVRAVKTYSGKVSLRMSPFVHENASDTANRLGISLNQLINDAIVDYTNKIEYSKHKSQMQNIGADVVSKVIPFPSKTLSPYNNIQEELEEI